MLAFSFSTELSISAFASICSASLASTWCARHRLVNQSLHHGNRESSSAIIAQEMKSVTVVGDLILDRYLIGDATKLNPEQP